MKLLTDTQRTQLIANAERQAPVRGTRDEIDFLPVVKLFTPDANCTWLLTELDPQGDNAFGLCDLGMGFPELGTVSVLEIEALRGPLSLPVERDLYFVAKKSLVEYAAEARAVGRIVA